MNKYKVYFNRKDNIKEALNEHIKDSLCHIIWLNKELSDTSLRLISLIAPSIEKEEEKEIGKNG